MLDECRKQDDELAQRLIVKELQDFGHLTSIDIAVSAEDQDFIAHPTCQALLSKLWMGAMELSTHTWQVRGSLQSCLLCYFFLQTALGLLKPLLYCDKREVDFSRNRSRFKLQSQDFQ